MLCLPREERASCAAPTTRCLSYAPCSALRTGEAETIHHSGTAWRSFARHGTGDGERRRGRGEETHPGRDSPPSSLIHWKPPCLSIEKRAKKQREPKSQGQRTAESRAFAPDSPISRLHASPPSRLYPTRTRTRTPSRSHRTPPIPIPIPIATPTPTHPASKASTSHLPSDP